MVPKGFTFTNKISLANIGSHIMYIHPNITEFFAFGGGKSKSYDCTTRKKKEKEVIKVHFKLYLN